MPTIVGEGGAKFAESGTEGSKEAFEKLARTEVGTIVGMHMSEDNLKEAEKNHINVIIAGHMSSDTIGINLILDTSVSSRTSESEKELPAPRRSPDDSRSATRTIAVDLAAWRYTTVRGRWRERRRRRGVLGVSLGVGAWACVLSSGPQALAAAW